MPVVVLSETTIALMREKLVIPEPDAIEIINRKRPEGPPGEFVPFKAGPNEVPPLPKFGEGYRILHSINPHDEWGGIQWDPDVFEKMVDRILGKVTAHRDDIVQTEGFFLDDAKTVLIAYGSESRPALGAVKEARANGIKVGLLKLVTVWPVPDKEIRAVAEKADKVLAVEMNVGRYRMRSSGSVAMLLRWSGSRKTVGWSTRPKRSIRQSRRRRDENQSSPEILEKRNPSPLLLRRVWRWSGTPLLCSGRA
jgi:pyruvate/2-oxoacid:ferredoxin oxidoreductase alpha subunit